MLIKKKKTKSNYAIPEENKENRIMATKLKSREKFTLAKKKTKQKQTLL